nr:uncharacterized protein LOC129280012 [Lytechinus pictus]
MVVLAVTGASESRQSEALSKKVSLSLWTRRPKLKATDLYPGHIANPSLRPAITIRAQISRKVYLTQARLVRIGKAADLCMLSGGRKSSVHVETFADDAFVMESEDDIPNTQQVDDRVLKADNYRYMYLSVNVEEISLYRMKSMQPKDVEEDVQRSAGWGTRKRRARVPHPSPAPLTIVNPAILVAETQPMTPVTGEVPHTPSLIPETPSSMKPCLDLLDSIKKGKGSAKRRVSITNSPNISPSTPLRQRLFQCFTEEANSCTESPSTSVKLHKSGPVRRPASRRNLLEEDIEMETDTPSVELEAKSTVRGRRSTITNYIAKLPEGGEIKVGTASSAEAARSSRRRSHVIEATPSSEETKSGLSHPEVAESRRSRGRKSTPRGTKHLEVQEERLNKLGGEEAEINVNGGDASQSQGGVGEPKVQISSSVQEVGRKYTLRRREKERGTFL